MVGRIGCLDLWVLIVAHGQLFLDGEEEKKDG
jgi:hypothetical protein